MTWDSCISTWWWGNLNWGWIWKSFLDISSVEELETEWLPIKLVSLAGWNVFSTNLMQIQIKDWRNVTVIGTIAEVKATAIYNKGVNMSCMSYACYMKLRDDLLLQNVTSMSIHSATMHNLCPIGLTYCKCMIGNLHKSSCYLFYILWYR